MCCKQVNSVYIVGHKKQPTYVCVHVCVCQCVESQLFFAVFGRPFVQVPAADETGDRLATVDMGRKVGVLCPF